MHSRTTGGSSDKTWRPRRLGPSDQQLTSPSHAPGAPRLMIIYSRRLLFPSPGRRKRHSLGLGGRVRGGWQGVGAVGQQRLEAGFVEDPDAQLDCLVVLGA